MAAAKPKQKPKFTRVNANLFTEDVERLKRDAEAAGEIGWQPRLRKVVHDALRAKGVIR